MAKKQPLIDRWSSGHLALGAIYGITTVPWQAILAASVAWELLENPVKKRFPNLLPGDEPDSFGNAAMDVAATMFGVWVSRRYVK